MAASPRPRVLLVDDEQDLLRALSVTLRKQCEVTSAEGGEAALKCCEAEPPFEVIVSDMRMPGMSGAEFLSEIADLYPDTVRLLLTGQTDMESAIQAVNHGRVFRFLTKPIGSDDFRAAIADGVRQHRLQTAERDLLQNTLRASLKVLTDVLSLVNPEAFSCASRVEIIVELLCAEFGIQDSWEFRSAALLSQLGCVTLPTETVRKAYTGEELSPAEAGMFAGHPEVAHGLIASIPRLERAADIVRNQRRSEPVVPIEDFAAGDRTVVGSELLRTALAFDRLATDGAQFAAVERLREQGGHDPGILDALGRIGLPWVGDAVRSLALSEIQAGMVLRSDLKLKSGTLLAPMWMEIDEVLLRRLENFASSVGIVEPIEVLVPAAILEPAKVDG